MEPSSFVLLARYNQWMNTQLHQAAVQLTDENLKAPRGAFFGSILGTLNHLAVGDTLWLQRFQQALPHQPALLPVTQLTRPERLDQTLFETLPAWWDYRQMLDQVILDWVQATPASDLHQPMTYHNTRGIAQTRWLHELLLHFFNHQTHHRGQASTLLHQAGVDVGVTDLLTLLQVPVLPEATAA